MIACYICLVVLQGGSRFRTFLPVVFWMTYWRYDYSVDCVYVVKLAECYKGGGGSQLVLRVFINKGM